MSGYRIEVQKLSTQQLEEQAATVFSVQGLVSRIGDPSPPDAAGVAAEIGRRIEGVTPPADANQRALESEYYSDQLRNMVAAWPGYPGAAQRARELAEWASHGIGDFAPPADADAIADAEQRGADKATAQIVGWLRDRHDIVPDGDSQAMAEFIERGFHLDGDQ